MSHIFSQYESEVQ